jgi:hypothetical protein
MGKGQLSDWELKRPCRDCGGDLALLHEDDLVAPDESQLPELSGLRRLLLKWMAQRLRKARGLKDVPQVTAPALPATDADTRFAQAGGVARGPARVATVSAINRSLSSEEVKARDEAQECTPAQREQALSNWLCSSCMKVGGASFTRRDVVAFVVTSWRAFTWTTGETRRRMLDTWLSTKRESE